MNADSVKSLSTALENSSNRPSDRLASYDIDVNRPQILIVDDEIEILELIRDALALGNFETVVATDGLEALQVRREQHFDLIITDVNMPRMNGYELAERLRQQGDDIPIIFLTARNERPDVAQGFRSGADDYVTKPFGLEELSLRVAAILKRTMSEENQAGVMRCGPVELRVDQHSASVAGTAIDLSPTEFRLLEFLMENKERVLTKHTLLDRIWGIDFNDSATVVDTYISYLRKKVHVAGFEGIKTVRGVGFMITERK